MRTHHIVFLVLAIVGVLVVAVLAWQTSRVATLNRRVGSFSCRVVVPHGARGELRFLPGVAHYTTDYLEWFRGRSLSPRPALTWSRKCLTLQSREPWYDGGYIVRLTCDDEHLALAMSKEAYAGVASWLEATPSSTSPPVL